MHVVTSYATSFTAPTRVYYWSHDTRTLRASGGLADMQATLYVYKFYVNDNDQICDAEGKVLGAYEDAASLKADYAYQVKSMDVTAATNPDAAIDTPAEIYATREHTPGVYNPEVHKYMVPVYYDQSGTTDQDFIVGDGDPLYFGEFQIFIGLKGDTNLNEKVEADDAVLTLRFYVRITVLGDQYFELNADPDLQELAFYVSDVTKPYGMDDNDPNLKTDDLFTAVHKYYANLVADDAVAILRYYVRESVMGESGGSELWIRIAGYDFPDEFLVKPD